MNLNALADAYLRRYREKCEDDAWVLDSVCEIVRDEPNKALELTLMLLKKAGDDDVDLPPKMRGAVDNAVSLAR
jgi:hypothetical protein